MLLLRSEAQHAARDGVRRGLGQSFPLSASKFCPHVEPCLACSGKCSCSPDPPLRPGYPERKYSALKVAVMWKKLV